MLQQRTIVLVWLVLALAAALPLTVPFPPLYDYHHWIFQGRITADLIFSHPDSHSDVSGVFRLSPVVVPNSATPAGIAVLSLVFNPEVAGRVFAALAVGLFAGAFAFLARSIQGRWTTIEFLGVPFASGYFLYKGYVSYLVALAFAFAGIACLHRVTARRPARIGGGEVAAFALAGLACYVSHLFGWIVFTGAVVVYAANFYRRGERRVAAWLLATLLPATVLLLVYLSHRQSTSNGGVDLYAHLVLSTDKLISLIEPFSLFLRPDPFEPFIPTFWLNAMAFALLAAIVVRSATRGVVPGARILAVVGFVLVAAALATPFAQAGGLARPDERLIFPGVLLLLLTVRMNPASLQTAALAALCVSLISMAHFVENSRVSNQSAKIDAIVDTSIPPASPVFSLTIFDGPVSGGCDSDLSGPSFGAPTMKWFGLYRLMDDGHVNTDLLETSIIMRHGSVAGLPDLIVESRGSAQFLGGDDLRATAQAYPFIEVFGCADDLTLVRERYASTHTLVAAATGFELLKHR